VLTGLGELRAPESLRERVNAALGEEAFPAVRLVASLPPLGAPAELDERVLAPSPVSEPSWAASLRRLPAQRAPGVLERLVREELADPVSARSRRFAGALERVEAPDGLFERVRSELRRQIDSRPLRSVLAPLATLAAALLFVWFVRRPEADRLEHGYSFRVVRGEARGATSLGVRLAESLTGGTPVEIHREEVR